MTIRIVAVLVTVLGLGVAGWLVTSRMDPSAAAPDMAKRQAAAMVDVVVPASFTPTERLGEAAFAAACADCHGTNAAGRDGIAPPLVHVIYEPSHHGDASFAVAVHNGVRAHHWPFGAMPPVPGLTRAEVLSIIAYVRALQRENGIL